MTLYEGLKQRWEARREDFQRLGVMLDGVKACDLVLDDLEALQHVEDDVTVNLQLGASLSGYSADHLGRLVRQGTVPNAGRPSAPRIRMADLPRKPVKQQPKISRYDPDTDARTLVSRRKGGAYGLSKSA